MLFFIWLSNNLMLEVPIYPIFEMQDSLSVLPQDKKEFTSE